MRFLNLTSLTLAALFCTVTAQSSNIVYNDTQIKVQSTNQYSGNSLIGYHVGAALSYIVARASASGSAFAFNLSATSAQLLDNNIAIGYQLPCYVINTPQISNNSGPLECGAGDQNGYYDVATVTASYDPNPGRINFAGIKQWYICAVQSFTYGWVQGTIVGSFGNGIPTGDGIQNCTTITGLAFAINSISTTSTTSSATTLSTSLTTTTPSFTTIASSLQTSTWTSRSVPSSTISSSGTLPTSTSTSISGSVTTSTPMMTSGSMALSNPAITSTSGSTNVQSVAPASVDRTSENGLSPSSMTTLTVSWTSTNAASGSVYPVTPGYSTPVSTYTGSTIPVATYTGAATKIKASALSGLVVAMIIFQA